MNIVTRLLLELQEMSLLAARAARGIFRKPRYIPESITQMDYIGVGSMTIIILTGFFTGGVLTLQTYQTLESYGAVDQRARCEILPGPGFFFTRVLLQQAVPRRRSQKEVAESIRRFREKIAAEGRGLTAEEVVDMIHEGREEQDKDK